MNPLAFIADERVDPVEIFHIANIQKRSLYTRPGLVALLSINPYICKMDRLPVLILALLVCIPSFAQSKAVSGSVSTDINV